MKRPLILALLLQFGCTPVLVPSYYGAAELRSGTGQALLPDGSRYAGPYRRGLFHGEGTLTGAEGDVYTGSFHDGLRHGRGSFKAANGITYEGLFANGTFHGQGRLRFTNGDAYQGEFEKGQMQGQGQYIAHDDISYTGTFKNDAPAGFGVIAYPDDARYEGEWLDWQPAGDGVWIDTDGTTYAGHFEAAKPSGVFHITYADGETYHGQMDGWSLAGPGRYVNEADTIYEGDFKDGELTGMGTITADDGSSYTGEVVNWYPHGAGQLRRSNNEHYDGSFERGRYSGVGTLTRADGAVYTGTFRSGKFHGEGTLRWTSENGEQTLTGSWRKGLYVGPDRQAYLADGIAAADSERLLFQQKDRLDIALQDIKTHRADTTDLYLLTFAGHGQQNVFRAEADTARVQLSKRYDLAGRAMALVNHPETTATQPLATATNLDYALSALRQKMDPADDVLFLFLTSHGSTDHALSVNLPGASMEALSAQRLAHSLEDAGIVWRIIVVSACYSGGFIESLQNEHSLIMTSARADRTAFGCSDDAEMTYFGRAFYEQALPTAPDLISAFFTARKLVTEREKAESFEPSEPQIHIGAQMEAKLERTLAMRAMPASQEE